MMHTPQNTLAQKIRFSILAGALLAVTACTQNQPLSTNTGTTPDGTAAAPKASSFAQFTDLPIPGGAKMDVDLTRVFGGGSNWMGDLYFSAGSNQSLAYDFFKTEMPNFGWTEITTVRSKQATMTYEQKGRIANIDIIDSTLSGAQVHITVSPRSNPADARPMNAPMNAPMGGSPGVGAPPPGYVAPR